MNISNLMGLNSYRNLCNTTKGKVVSSNRLTTGKRINSAKDDASGLAISEKMKAQIRGLNQADRNIADGMSVINTMDGGMDGITEILQRQRKLTIQAMNDTNTPEDKELIQYEIDELSKEITSMANKTQFNGIPLLNVDYRDEEEIETGYDGDFTEFENKNPFSYGSNLNFDLISTEGEQINVFASTPVKFNIDGINVDLSSFTNNGSVQTGANTYTSNYSYGDISFRSSVTYRNDSDGKAYADITYSLKNNGSSSINVDALFSYDTDFGTVNPTYSLPNGAEVDNATTYTDSNIPNNISFCDGMYPDFDMTVDYGDEVDELRIGHYSQIDDWGYTADGSYISDSGCCMIYNDTTINAGSSHNYSTSFSFQTTGSTEYIPAIGDLLIQCGANSGQTMGITRYNCTAEKLGVESLPIDPYENASKSLDNIDKAINEVSANRANAGAQFNRLEYTQSSVQISSENLESSKSRILDAGMAKETMAILKNVLLENAAIAILSQSNQQTVENVQALLQ